MPSSNVLVLNCGSSSVKFSVFDHQHNELASGLAERLGSANSQLRWQYMAGEKQSLSLNGGEHQAALHTLIDQLNGVGLLDQLMAIGHRVVHGGEHFSASVLITDEVLEKIEDCNSLAPLHNPANLLGVQIMQDARPELPQVAVFDTAFHQSLPKHAFVYGIPYEYYTNYGIRRYGFHGTSHRYVSQRAAEMIGQSYDDSAIICAHLGNGCSTAAVLNGRSIDTSMGLTPLEGLLMGTRSGDIDPSIHQFLANRLDCSLADVTDILNKKSGLLGISGLSNDMRSLCAAASNGNEQAQLAIDVFCYRLAKNIASLAVSLGRLDALVFTGGIGENADDIRAQVVQQLGILGFAIDSEKNLATVRGKEGDISADNSLPILAIATQEEWMIAQDTFALVEDAEGALS